MNTRLVAAGDVIEVDHNGRIFFALVTRVTKVPGSLNTFEFRPITPGITYRTCKSHQVRAHFKRTGRSRQETHA